MDTPQNLLGLNRTTLERWFAERAEPPYRATQLMKWVHQLRARDFAAMSNLSKQLRAFLDEHAEIRPPTVVSEQRSGDGTVKWLLRVDSGNCIETVFIPDNARGTLCVSSQVGCALNCRFCATAQQGFNRNLSAAEIIGQVWLANEQLAGGNGRPITNVVLMGMGEPLLNFENVTTAIDLMLDDFAYSIAKRRVTLSTAGVVPGIQKLKSRAPVSLAVSLHAPDNALRDELVPLNRTYPIEALLESCWDFVAGDAREKVTFEYVMLDGVNDSRAHAKRLVSRLRDRPAKVNLIPFNTFPGARYRRSPTAAIDEFRALLVGAGVMTITRKTRGDDIEAACGQLAGQVQPRSQRVAALRGVMRAPAPSAEREPAANA